MILCETNSPLLHTLESVILYWNKEQDFQGLESKAR